MPDASPILAMILSAIGNILMSLGAVIQKKGADQAPEIGKHPLKKTMLGFITNKTWLMGVALALIGLPVYLVAFTFGELIYVQPMVGLGTLTVVIYAVKFLKEKTTKTELLGILLIIIGPVIIAYGAESITSITSITSIFDNLSIYVFYIAIYILLLMLIFTSKSLQKGKKRAVMLAATTGIFLGMAAISGRLSALSDLSILFIFLLIVNLAGGAVFAQIMYQQGRAVITLTISNVFNVTLPVVAGILILSEKITPILAFGIIIILIGCMLVSKIQSTALIKK
jgi:drug/metabolite transporter (DMT)-like permease